MQAAVKAPEVCGAIVASQAVVIRSRVSDYLHATPICKYCAGYRYIVYKRTESYLCRLTWCWVQTTLWYCFTAPGVIRLREMRWRRQRLWPIGNDAVHPLWTPDTRPCIVVPCEGHSKFPFRSLPQARGRGVSPALPCLCSKLRTDRRPSYPLLLRRCPNLGRRDGARTRNREYLRYRVERAAWTLVPYSTCGKSYIISFFLRGILPSGCHRSQSSPIQYVQQYGSNDAHSSTPTN